ncbi:hypothetical protein CR513_30220, partial [Mucuna pruriens]
MLTTYNLFQLRGCSTELSFSAAVAANSVAFALYRVSWLLTATGNSYHCICVTEIVARSRRIVSLFLVCTSASPFSSQILLVELIPFLLNSLFHPTHSFSGQAHLFAASSIMQDTTDCSGAVWSGPCPLQGVAIAEQFSVAAVVDQIAVKFSFRNLLCKVPI